jgi:CheY-like chemotaxis protein
MRILIADDSATMRRLVRGILEFRGYQLVEAATGEEALRALDTEADALHLAILDLKMPGPDGLEVLRSLRAREAAADPPRRPLPVIILTAEEDVAETALDAGASRFLVKPFEPVTLLQTVEALLAGG